MKNLVAKLQVVGMRESGERVELTIQIGRPHEQRDGRWACEIAVDPLKTKFDDVVGTDSFHAVWLACVLALKLLGNLQDEGWKLANPDGSAFPLEEYRAALAAR
jgi:hypothetical protein